MCVQLRYHGCKLHIGARTWFIVLTTHTHTHARTLFAIVLMIVCRSLSAIDGQNVGVRQFVAWSSLEPNISRDPSSFLRHVSPMIFFFFFFPFLQRSLVIVPRRELKYYTRNKTSTKHRTKSIGRFTKHALRTSDIILYPSTYTRDESKTDKTARLLHFYPRFSKPLLLSRMVDDGWSTNFPDVDKLFQRYLSIVNWFRGLESVYTFPDRIICKL